MILTNVAQGETMAVPGFEHHTFMCSECQDIERRFVLWHNRSAGMKEQCRPECVVEEIPEDPSCPDGPTDMYLILDGKRIAKRGKPGATLLAPTKLSK
jgi:hypothetical protein